MRTLHKATILFALLAATSAACQATEPSDANAPEFFNEFKDCLRQAQAGGPDAPTRSECHWQLEARKSESWLTM